MTLLLLRDDGAGTMSRRYPTVNPHRGNHMALLVFFQPYPAQGVVS
ncbi:MAG TPA: hypothetical protein VFK15_14855 [Burkholderiales bacterium]|nr:hypothetical protein [Burkholderiales bacterium]